MRVLATGVLLLVVAGRALGVQPAAHELWQARQWAGARFGPGAPAEPDGARILVESNNDSVQQCARMGRPLVLGGKRFTRGLFAHAVSRLSVRLPGPGARLQALVGVDSNDQTSGGRGSVTFAVSAGGTDVWISDLAREGDPPVAADCDLGGATELILQVGDGGDGISCDQADWAEARVTLADGGVVWLDELPLVEPRLSAPPVGPPFSFTYGGRPFAELAPGWDAVRRDEQLDAVRTGHTLTYTDPATGLVVTCVAITYADSPAVEWTVYLRNDGQADTPVIRNLQGLDATFERWRWPGYAPSEFVLHHFVGSPCEPRDYEPLETRLDAGSSLRISAAGGRPTDSDLCYFNLAWPSEGVIIGLGWPGQWAATFERDAGTVTTVKAGQELTQLTLHPGEEIRAPLVALLFWRGDWIRGQNLWRRWMIEHNLPRPGGELPPVPQFNACSSHQFGEMIHADEQSQFTFIDRYLDEGLTLDYWWMDAGWYVNESGWPNTGTWEVDTTRFPRGLRSITDHAHERGVKSIVWFEPERVTPGTWLYDTHPEWLLGPNGEQKLLNLGNDEARQWLTDHVDGLMDSQGIDLYRNDFNIDPLPYWRAKDAEDRQGITEIRYVTGYLAYWDELRRRHPNILIDSCASGGRRNDLETLRRAVPLLRSDYILEPVGNQCHTYGASFWIPFYGTGVNSSDPYAFRSVMCPSLTGCWDVRRMDLDYSAIRRLVEQWHQVAPYFLGDYYPLTRWSLASDVWIGWQFDRPDLGQGMVQVFRRPDSIYESARLPLRGLEADAAYEVEDLDTGSITRATGEELIERGARVTFADSPGSLVLIYRRVETER